MIEFNAKRDMLYQHIPFHVFIFIYFVLYRDFSFYFKLSVYSIKIKAIRFMYFQPENGVLYFLFALENIL